MNLGKHIVTISLRLYKLAVSPLLHMLFGPLGGCRFTPTCSVYAAEAVALHGVMRGTVLAVKRLCRCHPWGGCGDDPVPTHFHGCRAMPAPISSEPEVAGSHFTTQRAVHFGCPPPR